MKNGVTWFELGAAPGTGPAMKEFYARTFGWAYQEMEGQDYSMIGDGEAPGIGGGLFEDEAGPSSVICIDVDDVNEYVQKAVANGATLVQEPTTVPDMVIYAKVQDPGGNVVGIIQSLAPQA